MGEPNLESAGERAGGLLRVLSHHVESVTMGSEIAYDSGTLTVSAEEARALVADPALAEIRLSWASPGESVRVIKVLDSVEPRTKGVGGGGIFPGFLGPARLQGRGETHTLKGVAVVAAGYLPRAQEGVIDMSGPGAQLSPLGGTHNLVLEFSPVEDAGWEAVDAALRRGLLKLAARLAEAAIDAPPDDIRQLRPVGSAHLEAAASATADGLPRVAAITNLQTQGSFKDVFVYGRSFAGGLPTLIDPNEVEDGAIVSGQFGHPGLKNPTYMHQNHPVVAELRSRDGVDLQFAGLVIAPEPVDQERKELISAYAARLCAAVGFDAVVITKEGGGNADADMSLKMDALEELGITAVGLFAEMGGPDGTAPPIVVSPERATGMVSTGNYDETVCLPAVERGLGGATLDLLDVPATVELELPTAAVYCSLSPLGGAQLKCEEVA